MNTNARGFSNDNEQPETAKPQAAANNGRDSNGRFVPGNPGGPGNPYARRVAELRRVMLECVTPQEMEIIVGELMVQAKCGNLAAIKLLFQYVLGKPPATVDPDTLDVREVEQYRSAPEHRELNEIVTARMPADVACNLLRSVTAHVGRIEANNIAEGLLNPQPECDADDDDGDGRPPEHLARAANDSDEPARPPDRPAPLPKGDWRADATRRRTTPPPVSGINQPTANPDGRSAPRPPSAQ